MVDQSPSRLWFMRAFFAWLAITILFLHLLPLNIEPQRWSGPDLMLALTFAWAIRRPEYVPAWSVGLIFLLADFLLQRPPGLWAALVVTAAQTLGTRAQSNRDMPFLVEWATCTGAIIGVTLAYRVLLTIFFLPPPLLGLSMFQMIFTVLIYPLVVLVSYALLGVRKAAPGEVDKLGHRL